MSVSPGRSQSWASRKDRTESMSMSAAPTLVAARYLLLLHYLGEEAWRAAMPPCLERRSYDRASADTRRIVQRALQRHVVQARSTRHPTSGRAFRRMGKAS